MANLGVISGIGRMLQEGSVIAPVRYQLNLATGTGSVHGKIGMPDPAGSHVYDLELEDRRWITIHLRQIHPLEDYALVVTSGPIR